MGASLQRIDQLYKPDQFDDTLNAASVAGIEAAAVDYQDFSDGVLSQIKRILWGSGAGNWHDDPTDFSGTDGTLTTLANRAKLEDKLGLFWRLNLNDVSVPASQNYVALTTTGKPTENIAIAATAKGAASAQLAGAIGSNSLTEVAGTNALRPQNIVAIFDGATGDEIVDSESRRIWGLLQVGSAATDGNAFGDSGDDQGQISFVVANATFDDLIAADGNDIGGNTIVYAYSERIDLSSAPADYFRGELAAADPQAGTIVSMDAAYNGGSTVDVDTGAVDWRLADTLEFIIRISGGNPLFRVLRNDTTGDIVEIAADVGTFDVNAADSDFAQGAAFDTGDQTINVGKTAVGVIDSSAIELRATTGDALFAAPSGEAKFTSTRETALPLDDATVGAISALAGGPHASIAAAIKYALESGGVDLTLKVFKVTGGPYNAGDNIPAATLDLSAFSIDMNTPGNVNAFVFLNGRLVVGGNVTTKNDVYVGTTAANGDLKHDFSGIIRANDYIITVGLKA